MSELPALTTGELRALRIAARHGTYVVGRRRACTPREDRIERHPLGRQYVAELEQLGLLAMYAGRDGNTREITPLAVEVLRSYWTGERRTRPKGEVQ